MFENPLLKQKNDLLGGYDAYQEQDPYGNSGLQGMYDRLDQTGMRGTVEKKADSRNFLEKALGLPEDQNFVFDIFELLGRPQQALFGAIQEPTNKVGDKSKMGLAELQAANESENTSTVGKMLGGAWKGLSGQEKYHGGQIVRNVFQDGKKEDGSFDWTDVVGMGMDVFLDPMSMPIFKSQKAIKGMEGAGNALINSADEVGDIISTAGKGALAAKDPMKAAAAADKLVGSMEKATAGVEGIETLMETLKKGSSAADVKMMSDSAKGIQDVIKLQGNDLLAQAANPGKWANRSAQQIMVDKIVDMTPLAGKRLNKEITKVSQNIGEKIGKDTSDTVAKIVDGVTDTMQDTFGLNMTELSELKNTSTMTKNAIIQQAAPLVDDHMKLIDSVIDDIPGIASKQDLEKTLTTAREYLMNPEGYEMTYKNLFDDLVKGEMKYIPNEKNAVSAVESMLASGGLNPEEVLTKVKSEGGREMFKVNREMFTPEATKELKKALSRESDIVKDGLTTLGDTKFNLGSGLSVDEVGKINDLMKNPEFKQVYDSYNNVWDSVQDIAGTELFGADHKLGRITDKNYVPHTANRETMNLLGEVEELAGGKLQKNDFIQHLDGKYSGAGLTETSQRRLHYPATVSNDIVKAEYSELLSNPKWVEKTFGENTALKNLFQEQVMNNDYFTQALDVNVTDYLTGKVGSMAKQKELAQMGDILAEFALQGKDGPMKGALEFVKPGSVTSSGKKAVNSKQLHQISKAMENVQGFHGQEKGMFADTIKMFQQAAEGKLDVALDSKVYDYIFKPDKTKAQDLLGAMDELTSTYKKLAVTNPGYLPKNYYQNAFNQNFAGVPLKDQVKLNSWSNKNMKKLITDGDAVDMLQKHGLDYWKKGSSEREFMEIYSEMMKKGLVDNDITAKLVGLDTLGNKDAMKDLERIGSILQSPGDKGKGMANKFFDKQMALNNQTDNAMRIATYKYAKENPAIVQRLGLNNAQELVELAHFNPNNLSVFEKETIRRIIPFYTIKKQNMMFHMQNMLHNTDKYTKYKKGVDSLWAGLGVDESERSDWEKQNMNLPSPLTLLKGVDPETKQYRTFKPESGFSDLLDYTNPKSAIESTASSLTPWLKMPYEGITGRDTFRKQDIERYPGEPGKLNFGLSKKDEWLIQSLGLSGIANAASRSIDLGKSISDEEKSVIEAAGNLSNLFMSNDGKKNKYYNEKEELDKLQKALKTLEAKDGIEVPTKQELQKQLNALKKMNPKFGNPLLK